VVTSLYNYLRCPLPARQRCAQRHQGWRPQRSSSWGGGFEPPSPGFRFRDHAFGVRGSEFRVRVLGVRVLGVGGFRNKMFQTHSSGVAGVPEEVPAEQGAPRAREDPLRPPPLHPEPSPCNPQPCTLHPAHCTLHTAHCTLHTAPYPLRSSPRPEPSPCNPKPCTLHPAP